MYVQIKDFKSGMDRKRKRVAGEAGTLWELKNGHLTRGGDVEGCKRFVPVFNLPVGKTFGMAQVKGQLYTFGSLDVAASMPVGVQYQRLQLGTANMIASLDARNVDGKIFALAEFDDGNIAAFYDGTQITALDALADANSDFTSLADYLANKLNGRTDIQAASFGKSIIVRAKTAGVDFSISTSVAINGGASDPALAIVILQGNVTAVPETRAAGSVEITGGTYSPGVNQISTVTINGANVLPAAVNHLGDLAATANALAVAINGGGLTTWRAEALSNILTLTAPAGTGAGANGTLIAATTAGNATVTTSNASGGVTTVSPVAKVVQLTFSGTYQSVDAYSITLNTTVYKATGRASGYLSSAFVYKKRVYAVAGSLLRYSAISAPTDWTNVLPSAGASFINMNNDSEGSERLSAIEQYQTYVAIFSRKLIRLYALNTDAALNTFIQTLQNTGTVAPRSVVAYGNTDVFYLDQTGIRSIKARDASNAAFVSDVGTNIDAFVRDFVSTLSAGVVQRATGIVDPVDGRFWLAIGNRIHVLSYYPSAKVQAWSYYELGSNVDAMVVSFNQIYIRQGDTISLYGGFSGSDLPLEGELPLVVRTPFLNADDPATAKQQRGFDIACVGAWGVDMLPDPTDETKKVRIGIIAETTYSDANIALSVRGNLVAIDLSASNAGERSLSAFSVHFDKGFSG